MSNRHEAWQELCIAKANDSRKRADRSADTIAALEQQMDADVLSGHRPLDRLAMVKLQQEDLKRKIAVEKAELQKIQAVLQPTPAPPAAVVTGAGTVVKAPIAASLPVQQQTVQGGLALQQLQQLQLIQRQQLLQLQQQQQLQGNLTPAQVQQYLVLQNQQQTIQHQLLQHQLLQQQAVKKQ